MSQLALPLQLQDHAVFESFWPAGNDPLVAYLESLAASPDGPGCWIWGAAASGKSHLLQAVCERAGDRSVYLPLGQLREAGPGILDGLASRDYLCLDDLHAVAGDDAWEFALFSLWNELADAGGVVIASALATARECGFGLADLASRLSTLPAFHLAMLDDAERINALKLRAHHRGLSLPDDTAEYLIKRSRRDMGSLYALLDKLDAAALQAQRRLTIRFVRTILNDS